MSSSEGAVFLCTPDGRVERCLSGACDFFPAGEKFQNLAAPYSRAKAEAFWRALDEGSLDEPWEMELRMGETTQTCSCMGVRTGEGALVVVSGSHGELFAFYEELVRINSELTNALRKAHKDKALMDKENEAALEELAVVNSELTNVQRSLAKKNEELARLNAQKSAFLGMAAHDLRNPLGAVMNLASIMLDEKNRFPDEHQEFLQRIEVLSRRSLALVDDFLDATVLESGRLVLKTRPHDLVEIVADNLSLHRKVAEKKGMSIEFQAGKEPILILADRQRLLQVLDNLLSNAVKYAPPASRILVSAKVLDNRVELAVEDQGPGIPEKDRQAVFDLFAKSSAKTTGGEKSSGVGLAIAKRIVQAHGGTIRVEDASDGGARFVVLIPLADKDVRPSDPETVRRETNQTLAGPVLVVDDDRIQLEVVKALLLRQKVACRTAADIDEAVRELRKTRMGAVLTDLNLGESSGLDLLKLMQAEKGLDAVPVFALTGDADPATRDRCLAAGMRGVFVKPVDPGKLRQMVSMAVRGFPSRS